MKSAFLQKHSMISVIIVFIAALIFQISLVEIVHAQGTWTSQVSPATLSLYMVKAVNQNVAWASGSGGTVLRCIDGSTWTKVDGGAFGTNPLQSICAINANTAIVSLYKVINENAPRQLSDTTWIYRTTNGGSLWQIVFQQIGGLIEGMQMIDSLNGFACGDPTPGDSTLTVLRTRDGGAHWSRIATEPVADKHQSDLAELGFQQSFATTDTNHIWFTTALAPTYSSTWIRRTTDGGKTWNHHTYPHPYADALSFSDSLRGLSSWWGGGQAGCDRTTDGGQTWNTLYVRPYTSGSYNYGSNAAVPGGWFWMTDSSNVYEVNAGDTLQFGFQSARKTRLTCPTIYWIDMKKNGGSLYGWLVTQTGKIYKYEPLRWQFKKYAGNPILTKSASGFDASYVNCPCVLYVNGIYRMWYWGINGTINSVGYATSTDGINWTKYAGNPVLQADVNSSAFDAKGIRTFRVHYDGVRFHMLYTGYSTSNVRRIGYAYSLDGIHWTKNPTFVLDIGAPGTWDEGGVLPSDFRKEGSKWQLWYSGLSNTGVSRAGYASANDSVNWNRHPSMAPIMEKGAAGQWDADGQFIDCVRKLGTDYHMWYENDGGTDIGYAASYDGISWNKSLANPVLSPTPGTWDQAGVEFAWMVRSGKKHFLYYVGVSNVTGGDLSIGLAIDSTTAFPDSTGENTDTGIRNYSEVPRMFALDQNYPNPFNPTTVISYQLPMNSYVTLKVYDLLGREVATLVNEREDAGAYSVRWNASGFATGMFLVRIQAGSLVDTKKVLLMK